MEANMKNDKQWIPNNLSYVCKLYNYEVLFYSFNRYDNPSVGTRLTAGETNKGMKPF